MTGLLRSTARLIIIMISCVCVCAATVCAEGPMAVYEGIPVVYKDTDFPLPYSPDSGDLGQFSHDTAVSLVDECFLVWEHVSTATVQFNNAGEMIEDIDASNYTDYLNNYSDGINPVIFDDDGSIIAKEYGSENVELILGFAGSAYINTNYLEGVAVLNGVVSKYFSYEQFKATFVHEFGHFIGLDHCQINLRYVADGDTANDQYVPTMFPTATDDDTTLGSLNPDDEASLTMLYPAGNVDTYYGTISGHVLRASGLPVLGANVVAVKQGDEQMSRFSCVSDYLEQGTGAYDILVTPGTYRVYIEPINSFFTGGSSVGPYSEHSGDKSFVNPVDEQYYNGLIPVAAGETVQNIDFGGSASSSSSTAPPSSSTSSVTTSTTTVYETTTSTAVPQTSTTTISGTDNNTTTTTASEIICPDDTPIECVDESQGVYWCCPAERPVCGTGENWGTCQSDIACPAEAAAGRDREALAVLRNFRARVLARHPDGRELIRLYYDHSSELLKIISTNAQIRSLSIAALRALLPAVRERIAGDTAYVDDDTLRRLTLLCDAVAEEAHPRLAADAAAFCASLAGTGMLERLGFISPASAAAETGALR